MKQRCYMGTGFTGCGKTLVFEGYGLQAVRKCSRIREALAAEGTVFFTSEVFPQPLQPVPKGQNIEG